MTGVDVVVPCYNYGRYLDWCVGTLLNQASVRVRVLIIDDASEDDTPQIGEHLAAGDSRVEFRRHQTNAGHVATFNEGLLDWASAEYSLLISADDGLAPGALARATQLMTAHPDIGMAYGMATIITEDHGPGPGEGADPEYRIVNTSRFLERCCRVGNPVPSPTAVVRTGVQQRLGGYRADLPHSGDMEMWMRFALDGAVGVLGAVQGYYRWHGRNLSSAYYARAVGDLRQRVLAFRPLESRLRAAVPEFAAWFTSMCDRLGTQALWIAHDAFESGDDERYRECLAFAAEVHSSLRQSGVWKRLKMKQLLGRRAVRRLRPVLSWLRGETASPELPRTGAGFRAGASTGWWPDESL
jgi:hypothetical protein